MHYIQRLSVSLSVSLVVLLFLVGCGMRVASVPPQEEGSEQQQRIASQIFTFTKQRNLSETRALPGVNGFLWRATLEVLSFLPLNSADPFGGVILTDWYTPPEFLNERFKVNVYIRSPQLRADALRVSLFRQTREQDEWRDSPATPETVYHIENRILTHARNLRLQVD